MEGAGVRVSMDGRGRALDNVFVERLWRRVEYEEIYLQDYAGGAEAWSGLNRYFVFYNTAQTIGGSSLHLLGPRHELDNVGDGSKMINL